MNFISMLNIYEKENRNNVKIKCLTAGINWSTGTTNEHYLAIMSTGPIITPLN